MNIDYFSCIQTKWLEFAVKLRLLCDNVSDCRKQALARNIPSLSSTLCETWTARSARSQTLAEFK